MSVRPRFPLLAIWLLPLLAMALLIWCDVLSTRRVLRVSSTGGWSEAQVRPDAAGTDAAGSRNWLIMPDRNIESYREILRVQQMFAQHTWRVRHIDYENAPYGRDARGASLYSWCLGLAAWVDHKVTGSPLVRCVEHVAFYIDPALHALFLLVIAGLVTWRFGSVAGAVASTLLAAVYPFVGLYVSGAPDDRGLIALAITASLVVLVIGVQTVIRCADGAARGRAALGWFFAAGLLGGVGLWLSVSMMIAMIGAIVVGVLVATWRTRGPANATTALPLPGPAAWRAWAAGGALVTLVAYVLEFAPDHFGWELRAVHPLYGIAWLGLGELLARAVAWLQRRERGWNARTIVAVVLAVGAVAACPIVIWKKLGKGFFLFDASVYQLAKGVSESAVNFWAWLVRNGVDQQAWSVLLALPAVLLALWLLGRRATEAGPRFALWLMLIPAVTAFVLGWYVLGWWALLDGAIVALMLAGWDALRRVPLRSAAGVAAATLLPGAIAGLTYLHVAVRAGGPDAVPVSEIVQLIDRDLGNWIAQRSWQRPPVVIAPPNDAIAFYYYAGVKCIGTLAPDNEDGLRAAMRIVAASMPEEAKELGDRRGVTHYVLPSWDSSVDEFARMGMGQLENTFLQRLEFWMLPPWLRPIPYAVPTIAGYEEQTVTVLEAVDDQDEPAAMGRLGEYFLELGQLDKAAKAAVQLRRFPADLGAVVARAQIELALNDTADFTRTLAQIKGRIAARGDSTLAWDRRVSLAVLLTKGKLTDQAKAQVKRCFADANEARIRFLTTGSLYQLLALGRLYQFDFADPKLKEIALGLLPAEARERLAPH